MIYVYDDIIKHPLVSFYLFSFIDLDIFLTPGTFINVPFT